MRLACLLLALAAVARAQSSQAVNFALSAQTVEKTDGVATVAVTRGATAGALTLQWASAPGSAAGTSTSVPGGSCEFIRSFLIPQ